VTDSDPYPPFTAVSLRVPQFIARQTPFVADFNVPEADFNRRKLVAAKLTFARFRFKYLPIRDPPNNRTYQWSRSVRGCSTW